MSLTPEEAFKAIQPWIQKHQRTAYLPRIQNCEPSVTGSAFSCIPTLLPEEEWPACKCCNSPLELLVELDLATLPTDNFGQGRLQLFYCVSEESCEGGWEPFSDQTSLCRVLSPSVGQRASHNLNRFPTKAICEWEEVLDSPAPIEHELLGVKFDYHFNEVPHQPMELWIPELELHFVGEEYIDLLEESVTSVEGDKLGGWPNWIQDVEYPNCPECEAQMEMVMQIDSADNIPFMLGDSGVGHITQCPTHSHVVAFGWACS